MGTKLRRLAKGLQTGDAKRGAEETWVIERFCL